MFVQIIGDAGVGGEIAFVVVAVGLAEERNVLVLLPVVVAGAGQKVQAAEIETGKEGGGMGNGLGQTLFASQVVPVVGLGDLIMVEIKHGQIKVFQFAAAPEIVELLAVVVVTGVEIVFVAEQAVFAGQ